MAGHISLKRLIGFRAVSAQMAPGALIDGTLTIGS
jgi:hypothetical protein